MSNKILKIEISESQETLRVNDTQNGTTYLASGGMSEEQLVALLLERSDRIEYMFRRDGQEEYFASDDWRTLYEKGE